MIDNFVYEGGVDENGILRVTGHGAPILKPGCLTFAWGRARDSNFHAIDWYKCVPERCQAYCDNPTAHGPGGDKSGIATQFSPVEATEDLTSLATAGQTTAQEIETLNPVLDLAAGIWRGLFVLREIWRRLARS